MSAGLEEQWGACKPYTTHLKAVCKVQKLYYSYGLSSNLPRGPCIALQEHFKQRKPAKTAEQLARQRQQLLARVPEEQRAQIDEKMLGAATGAPWCRNISAMALCLHSHIEVPLAFHDGGSSQYVTASR